MFFNHGIAAVREQIRSKIDGIVIRNERADMQTQKPMQRLARRIRTLVGCVALCGLAVVSITAALPGGVASSASAYADDSIPAQTAKAVERHVIVSDGNLRRCAML